MKNSIYLLMMFLGLALTSCEPMEDIHDELDARLENRAIEGMAEYTLTEDDYDYLDVQFGNFSSLEEAGALIPLLLSDKFPVWGQGSLAQVTFDLFAPITPENYTVANGDYAGIGLSRQYFTQTSEMKDFLRFQFPQAQSNDYVRLTYRTVAVEMSHDISNDDFDVIEEELAATYPAPATSAARFNNFDRREGRDAYWSNEMILEAINAVLNENYPGVEGQTYEVSYRIYDGNSGVESMKVRYNGTSYVQFGAMAHDISNNDFDFIGAELGDEYPVPASSAAQYNNFDRRASNAAYWSDEMILEAVNALLMERYPDASEGAQFNVSFRIYTGSAGSDLISVVLENGTYVINEAETISTLMETQVFAYGGGSWMVPMELPQNIYTQEFGQRFNNFGNEADAGFYIGRWLEPRYPYAQDGDFVSVGYIYSFVVNGVRKSETRYASFIYDEEQREWEFIPSVIEQTLQFGHEGTGWVVDNTIVYTLADPADYVYIADEFAAEHPGPSASAKRFSNFDRRPGNANQWTDAMLLEAFNLLLDERVAPGAAEGQKYLMTFDIYNGTNTIEQMHLIKENGEWVPVQ